MAKHVPLIWPSGKAKYFLFRGLTRFLQIGTDLPVGLICRSGILRFVIARGATQSVARSA